MYPLVLTNIAAIENGHRNGDLNHGHVNVYQRVSGLEQE